MIFVVRDGLLHRKIIPSFAFPGLGVFLEQKYDHFIIGTFEVTIIKWPLFFDLVKFLFMKLKSLQKLQKCMSATSGFWMFRPF